MCLRLRWQRQNVKWVKSLNRLNRGGNGKMMDGKKIKTGNCRSEI
jgi:hypothetical protein